MDKNDDIFYKVQCPCKECADRNIHCHDACAEYKGYKESLELKKDIIKNEKKIIKDKWRNIGK